jgi:formylglycine-generating enzyme required for sulfatase activity/predicted Ser/Thr protein kinase
MAVQVVCPNPSCGASYSIADELVGRMGRCKRCGQPFALAPAGQGGRAAVGPGGGYGGSGLTSTHPSGAMTGRGAEPELPEQFGRYRILRRLGRGGMGSVYLAHDTQLDRRVALKVPHFGPDDGPDARTRFYREARAAATFDHPNLCPVYDVGQHQGIDFLTMPYIEGKPLSEAIGPDRLSPPHQAAAVVRKLALALEEAHQKGVIHRDLKPANIMLNRRRELVIMDFGLARRSSADDPRLTQSGAVLGTPAYMPPEQVTGDTAKIGPGCDIYSLGVILYEMLTGRRPFEGPLAAVLGQIMVAEPPPPSRHRPGLDPKLEAICLKAMAKKVEGRYATMGELAAALGDYLADRGRPDAPIPVAGPPPAALPPTLPGTDQLAAQFFTGLVTDDPSPPTRPPKPEPTADFGGGRRLPRRLVLAGGGAAAAALLLGIVVYVATDKGRIKIEIDGPQAEVRIDGQEVRIDGLGEPITLRAGQHELTVRRGDGVFQTKGFEVRRGDDNPVLHVEYEPNALAKAGGTREPNSTKGSLADSAPAAPPNPGQVITNTIGMKLVRIPAGTFLMGTPEEDRDANRNEKPQHRVTITRPFDMGMYEVTVGQFRQFAEATGYKADAEQGTPVAYGYKSDRGFVPDPQFDWKYTGFFQYDNYPVVAVSWEDAVAFCRWLSRKEGALYRLPTEAEWEYACRAGTTTRFYNGDAPDGLREIANIADDQFGRKVPGSRAMSWEDGYTFTAPVGKFAPNAFGLYDMLGNAWEWCSDSYALYEAQATPVRDPDGPIPGNTRVQRGGSFGPPDPESGFTVAYVGSAGRRGIDPKRYVLPSVGFRVVRVVPADPGATPATTGAGPAESAPAGATTLVGGPTLAGWARKGGGPVTWPYAGGVLTVEPGQGDILTQGTFGSFRLHAEFKVPLMPAARGQARGNSGIFLQGRYEVQILDSHGLPPSKVDCGAIYNQVAPRVNACKFPEQWQTYDITFRRARVEQGRVVARARVTIVHNGETIIADQEIAPTLGALDQDEGGQGPILLQNHGCLVQFRNIWIAPLDETATATGWVSPFNGKDLVGWEGLSQYWKVENGALIGSSYPDGVGFNTFLCSKKTYRDFELTCRARLRGERGNSGIQIRSQVLDPARFVVAGPQCDIGLGFWGSLYGERFAGNAMLKDAKETAAGIVRTGDFNDVAIRCVGRHVTITLNGVTTVDDDFPQLPAEGIIAWQVHSGEPMEVEFRDVRLREL